MEDQTNKYKYESKEKYSKINKKKVKEEQAKHTSKQSSIFYTVELKYYWNLLYNRTKRD